MIRTLLIEDDHEIADIVCYYLQEMDQYKVTRVDNIRAALAASCETFDVIILDIMLPDGDGIALCSELRKLHSCPIIFISCIDDNDMIIKALESGGDDYIVKPFSNDVLHARIQANLRRIDMDQKKTGTNTAVPQRFILDPDSKTLSFDGKTITLGSIEMRLMAFFLQHPREYFMSSELYRNIWGKPSAGDTRTVFVHICNLRKKLENDPSNPEILLNVVGRGYYFNA